MVLGIPPPFPSSNFQLSVSIEKISEPISQLPRGSRNNETLGKYCLKIFFFFTMEKSEGSLSLSLSIIHSTYRFLIPVSFSPTFTLYSFFFYQSQRLLFICLYGYCKPRLLSTTDGNDGDLHGRNRFEEGRGARESRKKKEKKKRRRKTGKKKKERRGSLSKGNSNVRHAARSVSLRIYASI